MSGASPDKVKHALSTHENCVGPGSYDLPRVMGGNVPSAKTRNFPSYSIGMPRLPNVLNPSNKKTIGMKGEAPPPNLYSYLQDNINFKREKSSLIQKEERFFEQANMPRIKQQTPI